MMAAFIVAIRGTVRQAVLLGVAATISHTAIVWLVALGGMYIGRQWNAETTEPYFQVASAALIIVVALWMIWRTWRQSRVQHDHDHDAGHTHDAGHHHDETRLIDTGHGFVRLEIFEDGVPPRFRLYEEGGRKVQWPASSVVLTTERPDGNRLAFEFAQQDGFLESQAEIPEPHEFMARLSLGHGSHTHDYDLQYTEHSHQHASPRAGAIDLTSPGYQDPHELAHANDIRKRFADRDITTGQIVAFGLTGGLIPCPAAITVLLLCLQLKKVAMGATLVMGFSVGLALTMVAAGVVAAITVRHASKRFSGFGEFARKAPYFSSAVILAVGLYVGYHGWIALP